MKLDLLLTAPFWILGLGGVLLLLLEVFLKKGWPRGLFTGFIAVLAVASALLSAEHYAPGRSAFSGVYFADTFTLYFAVLLSLGVLLSLILALNKVADEGIESPGEYYSLLLISTAGALLFASSAELITMFLGLEIMSMALYCLCGSALARRESSESALKYFLLGSFSSAFLLYGIALVYGLSGSTHIADISRYVASGGSPMLYLAMGLMLVGLVFKIGAVPFHFWAPDVYQGAPTPVTAYMACVVKASAVAAAMRIMWGIFPTLLPVWAGAVWMIALLTIIAGNLLALRQRSVKRMLAYSSIAHAGYIMVGFLAPGDSFGGGPAILYYLVTYTAMTMGAFGVVMAVSSRLSGKSGSDDILAFNGLGYSQPYLAALMSLFMLSLAGLPPGIAGLVGKFYVFSAAMKAGYYGISIVAMIGSTVSCYYYLRVIVAMYFSEASEASKGGDIVPDTSLMGALSVCGALVIGLGLFPSLLYGVAVSVMASF